MWNFIKCLYPWCALCPISKCWLSFPVSLWIVDSSLWYQWYRAPPLSAMRGTRLYLVNPLSESDRVSQVGACERTFLKSESEPEPALPINTAMADTWWPVRAHPSWGTHRAIPSFLQTKLIHQSSNSTFRSAIVATFLSQGRSQRNMKSVWEKLKRRTTTLSKILRGNWPCATKLSPVKCFDRSETWAGSTSQLQPSNRWEKDPFPKWLKIVEK